VTDLTSTLKATLPRPDKGLAVLAARNRGMTLDAWAALWISHAARAELDTRPTLDAWLDSYDEGGNVYALKTTFPRVLVAEGGQIVARLDPMTPEEEARALDGARAFLSGLD
jgi:hypothetical protein